MYALRDKKRHLDNVHNHKDKPVPRGNNMLFQGGIWITALLSATPGRSMKTHSRNSSVFLRKSRSQDSCLAFLALSYRHSESPQVLQLCSDTLDLIHMGTRQVYTEYTRADEVYKENWTNTLKIIRNRNKHHKYSFNNNNLGPHYFA